jgi:Type II CAAX prenyl endopeptidase Rce1-like
MDRDGASEVIKHGSGPLDDLALTLPVFVGYHLGVAFLPTRNAADLVTHQLIRLAEHSLIMYAGLTLAIGLTFAGVLLSMGREQSLSAQRFVLVGLEGVAYAVAMRVAAGYVIGRLALDAGQAPPVGVIPSLVMALGAGLYEEITFRVLLFGFGLKLLRIVLDLRGPGERALLALGWAVVGAAAFSGWHYLGEFGEPFELRSFVFRGVCGLALTVIYAFRGFAPAVWTHVLYDAWVVLG